VETKEQGFYKMGNAISYIKDYKNVEFVMIVGYVQKGWCVLFVRDKETGKKVIDFDMVRIEHANTMLKMIEEFKCENGND
jgi:hypothetical protein